MPILQPPKQRHSMQEGGNSLKFTIPSPKQYFMIFFFGFWLILWTFGEFAALRIVFGGLLQLAFKNPGALQEVGAGGLGGGIFMVVWLTGWTVGGGLALYTFLWQLAGKEIIEVSSEMVKIKNAIFRFGRTRDYSATDIKDFRISPVAAENDLFGWTRTRSVWGRSTGLLAFDYGAKTFRFGGGVDEAEAKQILAKIVTRFPQYRADNNESV